MPDGWAMSHRNKHPVETIKLFDFYFSPAGIRLSNYGVEGVHYTMKDGKPIIKDSLLTSGKPVSFQMYDIGAQIPLGFVMDPGYEEQWTPPSGLAGRDMYVREKYNLPQFMGVNMTPRERAVYDRYWPDLKTYMHEMAQALGAGHDGCRQDLARVPAVPGAQRLPQGAGRDAAGLRPPVQRHEVIRGRARRPANPTPMNNLPALEQPATGRLTLQPTPGPDAAPDREPAALRVDPRHRRRRALRAAAAGAGRRRRGRGHRHRPAPELPHPRPRPACRALRLELCTVVRRRPGTGHAVEQRDRVHAGRWPGAVARHEARGPLRALQSAAPSAVADAGRGAGPGRSGSRPTPSTWAGSTSSTPRSSPGSTARRSPSRCPTRTTSARRRCGARCTSTARNCCTRCATWPSPARCWPMPTWCARRADWLLHVARFDVRGTTSRAYNDEAAFRIAGALAWGYDWLHDELTEAERAEVRDALGARLEEVATHVIDHARIHVFPYDSHAVRSVASVMVPACIALLGEHPRAAGVAGLRGRLLRHAVFALGRRRRRLGRRSALLDHGDGLPDRGRQPAEEVHRPRHLPPRVLPAHRQLPALHQGARHQAQLLRRRLHAGRPAEHEGGLQHPPLRRASPATATCSGTSTRICELAKGTEGEFYNHGWWSFAFDDLQYRHDWPQVAAVRAQRPAADEALPGRGLGGGAARPARPRRAPAVHHQVQPLSARSATATATRAPSCCSPMAKSWRSRAATTSASAPACTASGGA